MRAWLLVVAGVLLIVTGAVWTLQGIGYLVGSPMTGEPLWTVIGLLVAIIGVVLAVAGVRRLRAG